MIVTPSERRRAERFEELLTGRGQVDESEAAHVALAARLQSVEAGAVDPAFRDRLRQRVVAVAQVQGAGGKTGQHGDRPPSRWLPRRLAIAGGTLATLVALSGVGAASGNAVPGDALYSVKRSRETAQLALARSDISRGQLHLQFARTRLAEAASVRNDDRELRRVLDDMDAATRSGMRELSAASVERQDRAPLDVVDGFVGVQRRQLIATIRTLPEARRQRALDSLELLESVRERSGALRPSLLCTAGFTGASLSDDLGPLPRRCAALPGVQPGGSTVPGGPSGSPDTSGGKPTIPGATIPRGPVSVGPSVAPPGGLPGNPTGPGAPTGPLPTSSPLPSPSPSGGTQGLLGSVTSTVGGVVGGLLGGGG